MGKYIKYEKLKEAAKGPIKVNAYDRGIFWVVPDPFDKETCDCLYKQYSQGMYISSRSYYVTQEFLDDKKNWNNA